MQIPISLPQQVIESAVRQYVGGTLGFKGDVTDFEFRSVRSGDNPGMTVDIVLDITKTGAVEATSVTPDNSTVNTKPKEKKKLSSAAESSKQVETEAVEVKPKEVLAEEQIASGEAEEVHETVTNHEDDEGTVKPNKSLFSRHKTE